ncbi:MAG: hypothetical protein LQ340_001962 [Diploschistes diacapsis]|nr:MAG: hypothetical protein LQ340_001962 [Diploschistes diacapsis]
MLARKRAARLAAQAAEPISYAHDLFIKGNREISQSSSTVELPEVCEDAGHTLVHYLYTGTYETLQSKDTEDKTAELRRNAHLYGIATKYDLTGLKLLAQTEIEKTQGVVAIIDFLNIAKDVFQILLEKDDWFTLHVKAEIERALEVDESLFRNIGFLELVGEVKSFDKFLVEIMGRIYIDNIAVMARKTQSPTNTSSSKLAFTPESSSISANEKSYDEPLFEGLAESTTLENPAFLLITLLKRHVSNAILSLSLLITLLKRHVSNAILSLSLLITLLKRHVSNAILSLMFKKMFYVSTGLSICEPMTHGHIAESAAP